MRGRRLMRWVLIAMTTEETLGVMPLVARGVESSQAETQSQAIEALETIGARSVLEVLLPLLEPDGSGRIESDEQALRELVDDFDPWLRALSRLVLEETREGDEARGTMPSLPAMSQEETQSILDMMDRVLVLQGVRMFSELDPEDLNLIARATQEEIYEPDAPIFVQGDIGDEMLVIVEGSAIVTVTHGTETRLVRTFGPGDHVGELSLLAGGHRSAHVHAGDEGVRALALSASDLLTVLEERPAVAMGMLGTLARRLIDQT
jgi:hypothetical protein